MPDTAGELARLRAAVVAYSEAHEALFRRGVRLDRVMERVREINRMRRELVLLASSRQTGEKARVLLK